MKDKLQNKLAKRFPELSQDLGKSPKESCMAWGFSIGNGWAKLFEMLCEDLDKARKEECPDLKFEQVKEKYGRLRVYLYGGNDHTIELTDMYEVGSGFICESCGKLGRMNGRGWIKCLCDSCRNPAWYKRWWKKFVYFLDCLPWRRFRPKSWMVE